LNDVASTICPGPYVEDYFRYDVRFIMNVTDIDDKIVMRAHLRRSEAGPCT